jgi:hypothetical protein
MPSPSATQVTTNTALNSCVAAAVDVRSCLRFDDMWKAHPLNWSVPEPAPFKKDDGVTRLYEDQCAIKISIALQDGGLAMGTFKGATAKRPVRQLGRTVRGALRAEEVAKWLTLAIGKPESSLGGSAVIERLKGKRGVVFFKDFWQREVPGTPPTSEAFGNRSGDHIDLWDGTRIPNAPPVDFSRAATTAPNPVDWWSRYFGNAKEVWFWELK